MTRRTMAYADKQERDGMRLRTLRVRLLLTQREVAAIVGCTRAAISLLEQGRASVALRRRVDEALANYRAEAVGAWLARSPAADPACLERTT